MKVFKKILSTFLTAAIMTSIICFGTVSAQAASNTQEIKIGETVKLNGSSEGFSGPYYFYFYGDIWSNIEKYKITFTSDNYLTYIDVGVTSDFSYEISENYCYSLLVSSDESELNVISTDGKHEKSTFKEIIPSDGNLSNTRLAPYSIWNDDMELFTQKEEGKPIYAELEALLNKFDISYGSSANNYACIKPDDCVFYIRINFKNLGINKAGLVEEAKTSGDFELTVDYADSDSNTNKDSKKSKISSLTISKPSNYTYTGKARKPAITIKDGSYTLKKGTDYTLSYKNNKDIGTGTVTIKGKGSYTGSKTIQFKIVPKKSTLKVTKKSDTKAKFTWTAVDGAEKYQIYYSTDGKTYKKLATVAGSKTSATISKLDFDKYDYKFKIRSYGTDDEKKYYSSFSKTVTIK